MTPQSPLTPDDVDRALAGVYARPELAPRAHSALSRWLAELWGAIRDFIAGLFPGVDLSEGSQRLVVWIVGGVILATAFAMLVHLVRTTGDGWRGRVRGARKTPAPERTGPAQPPDWHARADLAAARGDWREAALALYQALLLRLAATGAIRYDAAKTPGDYRREASADARAFPVLDGFLRLFEPIAFGGRPADPSSYARLRATVAAGRHG